MIFFSFRWLSFFGWVFLSLRFFLSLLRVPLLLLFFVVFGVLGWALFIEPVGVASTWSPGAGRGAAVQAGLPRLRRRGEWSAIVFCRWPTGVGRRSVARGTCREIKKSTGGNYFHPRPLHAERLCMQETKSINNTRKMCRGEKRTWRGGDGGLLAVLLWRRWQRPSSRRLLTEISKANPAKSSRVVFCIFVF